MFIPRCRRPIPVLLSQGRDGGLDDGACRAFTAECVGGSIHRALLGQLMISCRNVPDTNRQKALHCLERWKGEAHHQM